jgi:ABC-type phosphate transport system substrate-binding protein
MKKHNSVAPLLLAVTILAAVTAIWLTVPPHPAEAAGDPIVVIVNVANPVANLSTSDLKKLFLSDRSRWDTGKAVAPVIVGPGAPERTAFLKLVCGMNDADFSKYFLQAAFSGSSATPPKQVGSSQDVKNVVAGSPGAIGFVKAGDFHGDGSDGGVKAVKVDGTAAGDTAYKLRM